MTDATEAAPESKALTIQIPKTVEDLIPVKARDLTTEVALFMRSHWPEVEPYFEAIAGSAATIHGSIRMDEAHMVFQVQKVAKANGYAALGSVDAETLRKALRRGFKKLTDISVRELETQNKRLRIELRG